MPETPKLPDPEIIFRYPANWTLVFAFVAGAVLVGVIVYAIGSKQVESDTDA